MGTYPAEKGPLYNHAKAIDARWGPGSKCYNDNSTWWQDDEIGTTEPWKTVKVPHDYVVDQIPDRRFNEGLGFMETKNAWYRKTFTLAKEDKSKRITLYFEGVTNYATVWVNGCLAKRSFTGYVPFEVDITDYAVFGEDNVVSLYIDASSHEGWWYDGGGIYRNVWLIKTDMVSVDTYGVYVAPQKVTDTKWSVPVEITLRNDDFKNHRVKVVTQITDEAGNVVASSQMTASVNLKDKKTVKTLMEVDSPKLWDCESPNLYYVKTTLLSGEKEIDSTTTHFGFRTIHFDADKGFFLNGKHTLIKGLCAHEDFGLQGKAVFDRMKRYKISLMKEMGANGYRTSHYCQSEQTMDELDRQGFLVMDETRWFGTSDEYIDQLETLVKRDRNRPGVIMWSLGNEESHHLTETGKRFCERLASVVRRLDSTRPVTSAISNDPLNAKIYNSHDIIGINYNLNQFDDIHAKYPHVPLYSSENCATGTTRGWYGDSSPKRSFINAYDHDTDSWFLGRERTWQFFMEREWIAGGYQWIAFEHRGEALWPRLCSQSGAIDLFGQKKDAFYQNKSFWSSEPMVHILPHWNLKGREGEDVPVWVYTNCSEVELFYNGESMGRQKIDKYSHGEWTLNYAPGKVSAIGYTDGKKVCTDSVETTGDAVALKLEMQTDELTASVYDCAVIACYAVDKNGNKVPDAVCNVSFDTNDLGYVRSTGSDITDHTPLCSMDRKMRAGVVAALVESTGKAGTLKVYASAPGLKSDRLEIEVKEV